jgi:serine/threonine-protein kinase
MYHMVTGRPPFEGDTPSAVMHKHLKQPLIPPDHLNTSLSAGIGEIIEVAMAKNREDRYASTEDMLEDLRAVAAGEPPIHARRAVDVDSLEAVEKTARTIDIDPIAVSAPWYSPKLIAVLSLLGLSVVVNVVLLVLWLTR